MMWSFRPSALTSEYRNITIGKLFSLYKADNAVQQKHQADRPAVPSAPQERNRHRYLRTCQWNINHTAFALEFCETSKEAARSIAQELLVVDADILILNEFGTSDTDTSYPLKVLRQELESAGYQIHVAYDCNYPTAVAIRWTKKKEEEEEEEEEEERERESGSNNQVSKFPLDNWDPCARAAVGIHVQLPVEEKHNHRQKRQLHIYGTHLEAVDACNGQYRFTNVSLLLKGIQKDLYRLESEDDPVLIIGDFNQQRERDYTVDEWRAVCDSKHQRKSPTDDGVAGLLEQEGFVCTYDCCPLTGRQQLQDPPCRTNWKADDPPPSTHWSGTVIDYSYFKRGKSSLRVNSVYVSPCGLSDHRMIVTDWEWRDEEL